MARIIEKKRKGENKPYAYSIRVYRGVDADGKQMKPYQKTWKIPEGLKNEKKIQQELMKVVGEFETDCNRGLVSNDKRSVSTLAREYMEAVRRVSKKTTQNYYAGMLPLIDKKIGHIKLYKLTAAHINRFYSDLQWEDCRRDKKARAKDSLLRVLEERQLTQTKLELLTGLSDGTIRNMRKKLNVAVESAEKVSELLEIPLSDLFEILTVRKAAEGPGLASKTILEYHHFIHAMLDYAVKGRLIPVNPAEYVIPPKNRRQESEWFEIDEIKQIMDAIKEEPYHYQIMVYLLIETGMRRGELFGLTWDKIDFENRSIHVINNLQRENGNTYIDTPKGNKGRYLQVSNKMIEMLKKYKGEQDFIKSSFSTAQYEYNPGDFLFIQQNGSPISPSALSIWMKKIEEKYNLPHIYPHKFRHSQASMLNASNVDVVTISKRLGHAQVSTTQNIYSHLLEKMDETASAAITDTIWG